jgi:hypothetical protein
MGSRSGPDDMKKRNIAPAEAGTPIPWPSSPEPVAVPILLCTNIHV